jgi:hypothetical protein
VAKLVRGFQAVHMAAPKSYPDIAYHFLIDAEGRTWEGRPMWAKGDTPTNYNPSGHLLICLIGNFERKEPTTMQWQSLVELVAWASAKWNVGIQRMAGHADHASTLCPGRAVRRRLAEGVLERDLARHLGQGGGTFRHDCPERSSTDPTRGTRRQGR